ncbi:MAG: HEAT repeat domain-containing protein [Gammaproteobacteria bacterium]|nr:HEAT repeat domain-containing protein [Gammaproteobacteria bacterium]
MRWLVHSVWLLLAACGGGGDVPPPLAAPEQFIEGQAFATTTPANSSTYRKSVKDGADHPVGLVSSSPVAYLIAALDDLDPLVREGAIDALGDRGDPEGISGLQRALYSEHSWLKLSAIEALADIGTDDAALALGPHLSDDDSEMREAVVEALADIGSEAARGFLHQALLDSDPNVREMASEALQELFEKTDHTIGYR